MLEHTYDSVDHISLHMYFANREQRTPPNYLAHEREARRLHRHGRLRHRLTSRPRSAPSKRRLHLASTNGTSGTIPTKQDRQILDGNDGWPHAPRLLEDIYNFEDVLQVGCILNTFIRRSDVVKIACIAQLVNVIAPIMTDPGRGLAADDLLPLLLSPRSTAAARRCSSRSIARLRRRPRRQRPLCRRLRRA